MQILMVQIKEASINNIKWKNLKFSESNLTSAEFYNTQLKNLDLRTSTIKNIKVTINNLKGLIVNLEQALELSLLLGINIKE